VNLGALIDGLLLDDGALHRPRHLDIRQPDTTASVGASARISREAKLKRHPRPRQNCPIARPSRVAPLGTREVMCVPAHNGHRPNRPVQGMHRQIA
jgi:hypothetical protein